MRVINPGDRFVLRYSWALIILRMFKVGNDLFNLTDDRSPDVGFFDEPKQWTKCGLQELLEIFKESGYEVLAYDGDCESCT